MFAQTIVCGFDDQGRGQRPSDWKQHAQINDVFFVDENRGWAVGDQGLILRTIDGGLNWQAASNAGLDLDDKRSLEDKISNMRPVSQTHELDPITCSLKSVHFINEHRGWIAGNYYTPLLDRSHSVILRTEDGGESWESVKNALLPEINRIHFQHVLGGWAIGSTNSLNRSGILTTSSGGGSWSSQTIEPAANLIDGDLIPSGFVVIDDKHRLGKVSGRQFELAVISSEINVRINAVRMFDGRRGWAVGNRGTILATRDGGSTWSPLAASDKQLRMLSQFDFATLQVAGERVFVAGDPGNILFSFSAAATSDDSLDLQTHRTGVQTGLQKMNFVNDQHGWAVGGLGTIIATSDSGKTWRVQRGNESRVAILAVAKTKHDLPFAFLSRFSGEECYLSASILAESESRMHRQMAASAINRVGCSLLADLGIEQGSSDSSERELEAMVRHIRCHKPNVLVCGSLNSSSDSMVMTCRNAIELASNANAYEEQISLAGLSPWRVDRFVVRTEKKSEFTLQGVRFLPSTGILLQDQIAISRAMAGLNPVYRSSEHYRVESFTGTVTAVGDDIMYGLETLGRDLPRREHGSMRGSLGAFATSPLKIQRLNEIRKLAADPANQNQVEGMIRGFGGGQDAREQGIWLWQLADELLRDGQNELAAYALNQLSTRFHNHPLTPAAIIWLANHYSSSEVDVAIGEDIKAALALVDTTIQHASKIETTVDNEGVTQVKWEPNEKRGKAVTQAQFIEDAVEAVRKNRIQKAVAVLNRLKQRDPDLAMSESVRFMEAKLGSKLPGPNSSEALFKSIRRTGDLDSPYRFASSRELKTTDVLFTNSLPVCFKAESRPLLDGSLDDDVWQNALELGQARMRVVTPSGENSPTNTDISWLAYDEQFLYLAARCRIQANHKCKPKSNVRTRDPDIQQHDRIRLELDFDRDMQSSFVFEVDACGRATDSCAGSAGWNPDWYVAVQQDAKVWVVECAIPLEQLVADGLKPGGLIAHRFSRLDADAIDLWADSDSRKAGKREAGIVTGLKIEPKRYEFLQIAEPAFDSTTATELP